MPSWSWPPQQPLFTILLGAVTVAMLVVVYGHWRRGLLGLGAVLLSGAVLRLVLPTRRVGLLAVRGRVFDVMLLTGLGIAITAVTLAVPVPAGS